MRKKMNRIVGITSLFVIMVSGTAWHAQAQEKKSLYPTMAPLSQYLIADKHAEIALARSAAPAAIADKAEVMVLGKDGYTTAVQGSNGFLCIVERSWAKPTTDPDFWNPKISAPNCFNAEATQTFVPIYLMKTKLVLAGKSKAEILAATTAALDNKKLPSLAPGAMCYMMSKQQDLSDGKSPNWHPHLMFFVSGDAAKTWGANLPGSPVIAGNDPQERVTIFMAFTQNWSDGSQAPHVDY